MVDADQKDLSLWRRTLNAIRDLRNHALELVERRRAGLPLRWTPDEALRPWALASFRPQLREAHEPYVRYLVTALRDRSDSGPRNIALSAGYGLGKSSVMRGVVRAFPRRVVHVTLGPLKRGVGATPASLKPAQLEAEVRSVQQEVVKQLLYSATQVELPRSRFRRLDRFRLRIALPIAAPIAALVMLVIYNNRLAPRVEELLESLAISTAVAYGLAWALLVAVLVIVVAGLGRVVRIGKVSAGSNSIELTTDDKGVDYFDRYLDEIVYFFQQTRRDIVVFEDIDRFGNAEVFEELRELNTLLNQAGQIRRKPIRFVYSVRDSLFDEWPADSDVDLPLSLRRATQRMKFFDLVVPMVPTITHRTARDVVRDLRKTYAEVALSEELVQEVARHVPDMRVLTGILNELKVFRSLLNGAGRPELDVDESFAVVTYKVHEARDFELVQFNESKLDKISDHAEAIIQARAAEVARLLRVWDDDAEVRKTEAQLAQVADDRLMEAFREHLEYSGIAAPYTWSFDGIPQPAGAPTTPDFWQSLLDGKVTTVQISGTSRSTWSVPAPKVLAAGGVSASTWGDAAARVAQQRRADLLSDQRTFTRATWQELYQRTDLSHDGDTFAKKVLTSFADPIVPRLIELGFLNEGFFLHASVFYGEYLGSRATTFLYKYVNRRVVAMDFILDDPDDVVALVELLDGDFLTAQDSALNVSIVDVLVERDMADDFFARYGQPSELEIEFALAYLRSGRHVDEFLAGLASRWAVAFDFVLRPMPEVPSTLGSRLTSVLRGASAALQYRVDSERLESLRVELQKLPLLGGDLSAVDAARFATVLKTLGVEIESLAAIRDELREAIRETGGFAISHENLSLLGNGCVALDAFLRDDAVLQRIEDGIDTYVDVLDAASQPSVADVANFETVMERFDSVSTEWVEAIASRSASGAMLSNLDRLTTSAWPPLLRAKRVIPTMEMVDGYLEELGVDETLLKFLSDVSVLDPGESSQADRREFAVKFIASTDIPVRDRARLLESLRMDKYVSVDQIEVDDDTLPGALLNANIIAANAATFVWAQSAGFEALASALRASTKFAEVVSGVPLSSDDLENLFDPKAEIPQATLDAINVNLAAFEPRMTAVAWRRYAAWAARTGSAVSDATLISLPGRANEADLVDILIASGGSRTAAVVAQLVGAMGGKYARVVQIAPGSETFDRSDRMAELAGLLVRKGLARSWRRTLTDRVQVYRRRRS